LSRTWVELEDDDVGLAAVGTLPGLEDREHMRLRSSDPLLLCRLPMLPDHLASAGDIRPEALAAVVLAPITEAVERLERKEEPASAAPLSRTGEPDGHAAQGLSP
jgi:hypothetical protein